MSITESSLSLDVQLLLALLPLFLVVSQSALLSGGPGKAIAFQGRGEFVTFTNFSGLNTTAFTFEFWMLSQSFSSRFTPFSYATDQDPHRFVWTGVELWVFGFEVSLSVNSNHKFDQWHHYAFVWNGSTNTLSYFIDGTVTFEQEIRLKDTVLESGGTLVLGQYQINKNGPFSRDSMFVGMIDEFRIWRVARTAKQIKELMGISVARRDGTLSLSLSSSFQQNSQPDNATGGLNNTNSSKPCNNNCGDLVSAWTFDTEYYQGFTAINGTILDIAFRNPGTIGEYVYSENKILLGSSVSSPATYCPSGAQIIAPGVPSIIVLNWNQVSRAYTKISAYSSWLCSQTNISSIQISFTATYLLDSGVQISISNGSFATGSTTSASPSPANTSVLVTFTASECYFRSPLITFESIPILFSDSNFPILIPFTVVDMSNSEGSDGTIVITRNSPPEAINSTAIAYEGQDTLLRFGCIDVDGGATSVTLNSIVGSGSFYQVVINYSATPSIVSANSIASFPAVLWEKLVAFSPISLVKAKLAEVEITYFCNDGFSTGTKGTLVVYVFPTQPDSLVGTALWGVELNGRDSYGVTKEQNVSVSSTVSVEAWVYIRHELNDTSRTIPFTVLGDSNQTLFVSMFAGNSYFAVLLLKLSSSFGFAVHHFNGSSLRVFSDNESTPILDSWNHIAVVLDDQQVVFLVNGVRGNTIVTSGGLIWALGDLYLGGLPASLLSSTGESLAPFEGRIDELKIWKKAFTKADYDDTLKTKRSANTPSLLYYWDFNEGSTNTCTDLIRNASLNLFNTKWVKSGIPQFNYFSTVEGVPVVIQLSASQNAFSALIITSLPVAGSLYQYSNTTENVTALGPPISLFNNYSDFSNEMIRQWVTKVIYTSSQRQVYSAPSAYAGINLVGTPKTYNTFFPSYTDSPLSWAPQCNVSKLEYAIVQYNIPVFIWKVQVYESYNPGSTESISAWNNDTQTWVELYRQASQYHSVIQPRKYTLFAPQLCQPTFASSMLRVEFNACKVDGWSEIQAIELLGTTNLRPGVVSDPYGRVIYVPLEDKEDEFWYASIACPFESIPNSPTNIIISVSEGNDAPKARSLNINLTENIGTFILLNATDVDTGSVQFFISELPTKGRLFQVTSNKTVAEEFTNINTNCLTSTIYYVPPPNLCGIDYDNFQYSVSDTKSISGPFNVSLNVFCEEGKHTTPPSIISVVSIVNSLMVVFSFLLLIWIYKYRKNKLIRSSRPFFLYMMVGGSILVFVSVYLFLATMSPALCSFRMWLFACGYAMIIGSHFARVYQLWRYFCSEVFSRKNLSKLNLFLRVGLFFGGQLVVLIAFNVVSYPGTISIVDKINPALTHRLCSYDPRFIWGLVGYNMFMLLLTCFFCVILSKTDMQFVGSVPVYTFFGVSLATLIVFWLLDPISPVALWVFPLSMIIAVSVPQILFFIPNFFAVTRNEDAFQFQLARRNNRNANNQSPSTPEKKKKPAAKQASPSSSSSLANKSLVELLDIIQQKDNQIAALENKLLQKKNQLKELIKNRTDSEEES